MDIWKHGTYVDTWSIVHFASGFLLSGAFFAFGYDFTVALIASLLLLLLWEVFEWVIKIIEPSINVLVDIMIGLAGFFVGSYLYYQTGIPFEVSFYTILIGTIILAAWGFLDFLKKGYR